MADVVLGVEKLIDQFPDHLRVTLAVVGKTLGGSPPVYGLGFLQGRAQDLFGLKIVSQINKGVSE